MLLIANKAKTCIFWLPKTQCFAMAACKGVKEYDKEDDKKKEEEESDEGKSIGPTPVPLETEEPTYSPLDKGMTFCSFLHYLSFYGINANVWFSILCEKNS